MHIDLRNVLGLSVAYRTYQALLGIDRQLQTIVADYIRAEPGMRILDIGCGPGTVLGYLPDKVAYVGVDPSATYISAARQRFGTRGHFQIGGADQLSKLAAGPFDRVISLGVLHHLDDRLARKLVGHASAMLAPGGKFVSVDPTIVAGQAVISRCLVRYDRGEFVRRPGGYRQLLSPWFSRLRQHVRHDLLRVPYTEVIFEASGP